MDYAAENKEKYASEESKERLIELANHELVNPCLKRSVLGPNNETINRYCEAGAKLRIGVLERHIKELESKEAA